MNFYHCTDYDQMSEQAAQSIFKTIQKYPAANLCLATGYSPERTYSRLVERLKSQDLHQLWITKLDEWVGVSKTSSASCEAFIQKNFLQPLHLEQQYIAFDPEQDVNQEVERINQALKERPIDLCILGIGKNGHLGLNEPGIQFPYAHIQKLSDKTKTHAMLEGTNSIEYGMTLGLQQILCSKKIILLVCGSEKEKVFNEFSKGYISEGLPASFLWLHDNVDVYTVL